MAKHFDPRKILKQISNQLLKQFFTERGELLDIPWDELTETKIEPIFERWQNLTEAQRTDVQLILQHVNELADDRGLSVLAEEIGSRFPDRVAEFTAWEARADKVMWAYLNVREAFDEAAMFASADALAAGRYWIKRNGLPKTAITVSPKMKSDLGAAMTGFYWPNQMRGLHCAVEHYRRASGAEYFFAYLDDYPDHQLVFEDSGQIVKRSDRYAFENVFVFSPADGSLEFFVRGGKKVYQPLQVAFCRAVLGADVDPADPLKPAYRLDHLLDPNFQLRWDPGDRIAEARIVRMRLEPKAAPLSYIELKADLKGHASEIHQMIAHYLNEQNASAFRMRVGQVGFRITFMSDGRAKPKTLPFNVSLPSSCDLKSKTDEMRAIGERCLKLWGIVNE